MSAIFVFIVKGTLLYLFFRGHKSFAFDCEAKQTRRALGGGVGLSRFNMHADSVQIAFQSMIRSMGLR